MREKSKTRFNSKVRAAELRPGDRVLVQNVNIRGENKLADRWEREIHVLERRMGDGPVYVVNPEKGSGPVRTLHRDSSCRVGPYPSQKKRKPNKEGPIRGGT